MAKKSRRRSRPSGRGLKVISTIALRAELERRERAVGDLVAQRRDLLAQLASIDRELAAFKVKPGGRAPRALAVGRPPTGRKRHKNESNLEEALAGVLKGKTMGVTEVARAVQEAGYKTTSPNFRTIVNQALLRSKLIKKLARGKYTAA